MAKCVVTGGNGFIGSHVVSELLERGADAVIYDLAPGSTPKVRLIQDDIRNYEPLARCLTGTDYIFHLSGVLGTSELFDEPRKAIEINVLGALNILQASLGSRKAPQIFFPSKPNEWNNVYSVTAQAVEKLGHAYRENFGIDVRILKLPNVYGPRQKVSPVRKVVPSFITRALRNRPIDIFGDGNQILELAYVQDVAKLIVDYLITDTLPSETHEIASDQRLTVNEIADRVIDATGSRSTKIYFPQRRGELDSMRITRIRDVQELLGPMKLTSFDCGIQRTVEWYREIVGRGDNTWECPTINGVTA